MPPKRPPAPTVDFFASLKARANTVQQMTGNNEQPDGDNQAEKIEMLTLDSILPNPNQPRKEFLEDEDNELAADIKEHGILQPIIVRPAPGLTGKYQLVAGERRARAAKVAGLVTIPAIIKDYNDKEARTVAAIENLQRKNLQPLEEASYFEFLAQEYNLSNRDIAQLVHKSASYVDQRFRLLTAERVKSTHMLQDSQPKVSRLTKLNPTTFTRYARSIYDVMEDLEQNPVNDPKTKAAVLQSLSEMEQAINELRQKLGK